MEGNASEFASVVTRLVKLLEPRRRGLEEPQLYGWGVWLLRFCDASCFFTVRGGLRWLGKL